MGFKLCSVGTKGALGKYPPTIDTKQDASTLTYPVTRSPLTSGIKRAFSPENCCSLNIFFFSVYFSINPQDGCGKNPRVDQHISEVLTFAYLALTTVSCSKLTWKHMSTCPDALSYDMKLNNILHCIWVVKYWLLMITSQPHFIPLLYESNDIKKWFSFDTPVCFKRTACNISHRKYRPKYSVLHHLTIKIRRDDVHLYHSAIENVFLNVSVCKSINNSSISVHVL